SQKRGQVIPQAAPKLQCENVHISPLQERPTERDKPGAGQQHGPYQVPWNFDAAMLIELNFEHPRLSTPDRAIPRRGNGEKLLGALDDAGRLDPRHEVTQDARDGQLRPLVPALRTDLRAVFLAVTGNAIAQAIAIGVTLATR